ncbi:hypothetical protein GCM10029978_046910 [Actinoallomurus acanthiterrae]
MSPAVDVALEALEVREAYARHQVLCGADLSLRAGQPIAVSAAEALSAVGELPKEDEA